MAVNIVNIIDLASTVSTTVSPPSFISSDTYTKQWVKVGDGSSTYLHLSGTDVTDWIDKSGNNYSFGGYNGIPDYDSVNKEIDFNGTTNDDWMSYSSYNGSTTYTWDNPITAYMVVRINTAEVSKRLLYSAGSSIGFVGTDTADSSKLALVGGGVNILTPSSFYTVGTYFILTIVWNDDVSSGSLLQKNGDSPVTGTLGVWQNASMRIGNNNNGSADMSIKEVILRSCVDDSTNRAAVVCEYIKPNQ